jgi:hypothetical protein
MKNSDHEVDQKNRDDASLTAETGGMIAVAKAKPIDQIKTYLVTSLPKWINFRVITSMSHHSTGTISAIAFFKIVGWFAAWMLQDGLLRSMIEGIEAVGLISLFVLLLIGLLKHVWKDVSSGTTNVALVA